MEQPGKEFKRSSVDCFGYRIPFIEAGTGDVIISLPGSAGLEASTAKDMLAGRYKVIEFDPPGWGDTPALPAQMKQKHLAVILAEAVAELGIERYHLLGTSMGGTNAMWLAGLYPDRVKSLTFEAPMLFTRDEDLHHPEANKMIEALVAGAPLPDVSAYPAPPPHPRKPWATADFFRNQMKNRLKMMAKSDHAYDHPDLHAFASKLKMPIQLLFGTADEIYKATYPTHFSKSVPTAEVIVIPDAVHDVQNSAPEKFVEQMLAIVRRQISM
ncbi:MAG: alpha/beta hydrolase, partial [Parvularculaceae bacterium]|nr:alpha/beta hydrolase [Parvularculaceae bacterium]